MVGAPGGRGHRARPELIVDLRTEADAINAICLITGEWPHGNILRDLLGYLNAASCFVKTDTVLIIPETSKDASTTCTCRERAPWPSAAVPGVELRGGAGEGDDGREEGQALHRPEHAHGVVVGFRREGTVSSHCGSFKRVAIHVAWFISKLDFLG